jgi:WD40 repeat protein
MRSSVPWPELSCVSFSPDGLAVGDEAGVMLLLNADTGGTRALLIGHDGAVVDLVFTDGGKLLISLGADETVRLSEVPKRARSACKPAVVG